VRRLDVVPFNRPYVVGREFEYMQEAVEGLHLSGDGPFTKRCERRVGELTGAGATLLTHSCTAALEMAALLLEIEPGDEVVLPSFTFSSSANAFALRGATLVFVDVRSDTLNLDEEQLELALGPKTKAIVAVHYAGVPCEMDALRTIADDARAFLVEDAAQALMSTYRGRPLGAIGDLGAVSFHETKNVISGEGGALLVPEGTPWLERAEIIREKGTDRSKFFRGEVDRYSWIDIGSSYIPSELNAAFLWAQLEAAETILQERLRTWRTYHEAFAELERRGLARRPIVPSHCTHNAHLYYLLLEEATVASTLEALRSNGVSAVSHYVPLHTSRAGLRHGRAVGELPHTLRASERLIRLPLWVGMDAATIDRVVDAVYVVLDAPPVVAGSARSRRGSQA
jgi:dTDP-4-amino-4,6-dideoxygalactose transaminase